MSSSVGDFVSFFLKETHKITHREQLMADSVAQNLEIVSKTFSTNQNSAHDLRFKPPNKMVLMINPMRILVRLVPN